MAQHNLLADSEVENIANQTISPRNKQLVALALEVREYRKIYGKLRCDWLDDKPIGELIAASSLGEGIRRIAEHGADAEAARVSEELAQLSPETERLLQDVVNADPEDIVVKMHRHIEAMPWGWAEDNKPIIAHELNRAREPIEPWLVTLRSLSNQLRADTGEVITIYGPQTEKQRQMVIKRLAQAGFSGHGRLIIDDPTDSKPLTEEQRQRVEDWYKSMELMAGKSTPR